MMDKMKELLKQKEDIIYHLTWNCKWGTFEYEVYKDELLEIKNEINELKNKKNARLNEQRAKNEQMFY